MAGFSGDAGYFYLICRCILSVGVLADFSNGTGHAVDAICCTGDRCYLSYQKTRFGEYGLAMGAVEVSMDELFTPITNEHADSRWYIDEFGVVPAVIACCVAVYFWRKGVNEFERRGVEASE